MEQTGPHRSRRNRQLSQSLGYLEQEEVGAMFYFTWGEAASCLSVLSVVPALAEYDFPHVSGCNIITSLLAN